MGTRLQSSSKWESCDTVKLARTHTVSHLFIYFSLSIFYIYLRCECMTYVWYVLFTTSTDNSYYIHIRFILQKNQKKKEKKRKEISWAHGAFFNMRLVFLRVFSPCVCVWYVGTSYLFSISLNISWNRFASVWMHSRTPSGRQTLH